MQAEEVGVIFHVGVRILTGLSPPTIAHSSEVVIKGYALFDARGGHVPSLDKVACLPGDSLPQKGHIQPKKNKKGISKADEIS